MFLSDTFTLNRLPRGQRNSVCLEELQVGRLVDCGIFALVIIAMVAKMKIAFKKPGGAGIKRIVKVCRTAVVKSKAGSSVMKAAVAAAMKAIVMKGISMKAPAGMKAVMKSAPPAKVTPPALKPPPAKGGVDYQKLARALSKSQAASQNALVSALAKAIQNQNKGKKKSKDSDGEEASDASGDSSDVDGSTYLELRSNKKKIARLLGEKNLRIYVEFELSGNGYFSSALFEFKSTETENRSGMILKGTLVSTEAPVVMTVVKEINGGTLDNLKIHLCRIGKKGPCARDDGKETIHYVLSLRPRTMGDGISKFLDRKKIMVKTPGGMLGDADIADEADEDTSGLLKPLKAAIGESEGDHGDVGKKIGDLAKRLLEKESGKLKLEVRTRLNLKSLAR